ncbi:MAG: P-loop NTPase fold protein [[Clostridium] scindens]
MATIDELAYYCREENSFGALMLTGKWGCGKTYLIENDLSDELGNDYIIIRVSLFGESSVDNIHQKVQKAYFQEVMLNLGGNIVKLLPNIPEDKAAKMGEKVDKTMGTMAEKMEKSKIGRVLKFASEIAQNVSGLDKILSLNPSEYIPVEETIAGKRVILVFDDLERCDPDVGEVAILGCINEYCENKHIKTIIIANEEKIIERNQAVKKTDDENADDIEPRSRKIKYAEIKEKIVARTVKIFQITVLS